MTKIKETVHKSHSFSVQTAIRLGNVDEAIFINHLEYWIENNMANGTNYRDNRTWTYDSIDALVLKFPYWNKDRIRRITDSLVKKGEIIKKNHNGYDRRTWYAFSDETEHFERKTIENSHLANLPNASGKIAKSNWQNCQIELAKTRNLHTHTLPYSNTAILPHPDPENPNQYGPLSDNDISKQNNHPIANAKKERAASPVRPASAVAVECAVLAAFERTGITIPRYVNDPWCHAGISTWADKHTNISEAEINAEFDDAIEGDKKFCTPNAIRGRLEAINAQNKKTPSKKQSAPVEGRKPRTPEEQENIDKYYASMSARARAERGEA
jgi:hypothetical protein